MDQRNVAAALEKYGAEVVAEARAVLKADGKVRTGRLYDSLRSEVTGEGASLKLEFRAEDYWVFVDKGNHGVSPTRFFTGPSTRRQREFFEGTLARAAKDDLQDGLDTMVREINNR